MRRHAYYYLAILAVAAVSLSYLFRGGWYDSHDGMFHIVRSIEAMEMLKLWHFPLRWAGNLDQGYGVPLFNYIYPLPYYLTGLLTLILKPWWALKLVIFLSYVAGGVGMYHLFAVRGRFLALALAIIYLLTPYQFVNIFVRVALGEIIALGMLPWVYLVHQHILTRQGTTVKWYEPLPLTLLLLTHNFLGMIFGLFLFGLILSHASQRRPALISLCLSLLLSATFILPMLFERQYLYSLVQGEFTFRFDQHFVNLRQFFFSPWGYGYSELGPGDGLTFQLGFAQFALFVISLLSVVRQRRAEMFYLVLAYAGSVFLMSARSYPVWQALPFLQPIQFPWRFLFMTTFLTPVLGAALMSSLRSLRARQLLLVMLLMVAFWNIHSFRQPEKTLSEPEYLELFHFNSLGTTTAIRTEILPRWVSPTPRPKGIDLVIEKGSITYADESSSPLKFAFTADSRDEEGTIHLKRNYYPMWHVRVDGLRHDDLLSPREDGSLRLRLLSGSHRYTIYLGSTGIQLFANLLSLAGLIIIWKIWRDTRLAKP